MVAESTTFPIDLIKTRLQLHGESLSSSRPTSAFRI
ncbi:mitochondrial-like uncoupling protein 3-like, partial [Trifolium medium]|nr:mitochondrial-like uncoupling protein 3-like [Trifolium medium]